MPLQVGGKGISFPEDCDTIVIVSETMGGADGMDITKATVYSGACDFQATSGDTFTDPAGQVQVIDAHVVIDPAADGTLPTIAIADGGPRYAATVGGIGYSIVFAHLWAMPPKHLELVLKRGPGAYRAHA